MAGFVFFESNEDPTTPSPDETTANQNHGVAEDEDCDFEGQIMAIDERWIVLYDWNEKRYKKLREVLGLWRPFEDERLRLSRWFDTAEEAFRVMERSPTEETNELLVQATEITVRKRSRTKRKLFFFKLLLLRKRGEVFI